ncbi:MAG: PIG-L family deacetylase [Verrucomicrobiota bacterium]|nr:PIG-L family deacetylase [Verrucomicrobiota bacterium]
MLQLRLENAGNLLFLGAHSDDIEIGCGGTILKLASANPKLNILWVVFSAEGKRRPEARSSAALFLKGVSRSRVVVKQFRTSFFPVEQESIKSYFETLRKSFEPDIVFTHYREDRHQDHRLLSDLTWNTFRDHMILEYEIPKYDGDLGCPNLFVPLLPVVARRKTKSLQQAFASQRDKHWFSEEIFLGLMRLRGMECASRYAEAFYCRKMVCS